MNEFLIVLALILLNGLFALSELAVISSRRSRLRAMMMRGHRGAKSALELLSSPGRFLSAVQVGITLISILNGAISGDAFGHHAGRFLELTGLPTRFSTPLGYGFVVLAITYLSVTIGELVPKNLALCRPERIACAVAPFMMKFSAVAAPLVWVLDASTRQIFRLFGQSPERESRVTDEEIKALIAEAETAGVIDPGEREMIAGVMRLADRTVTGLMTPRTEVDWIDLTASDAELRGRLITTRHSLLPTAENSAGDMIGIVDTRELLLRMLSGKALDLPSRVQKAPIVPGSMTALDALRLLRDAEVPMALVHDEYGHFEGIVTPADMLEAVVGAFKSDSADEPPLATERADGSWLLSGRMPVDLMAEVLDLALPEKRDYQTLAGYILSEIQHLPKTGEQLACDGWCLEIVDLDGRRIDKVLATRRNRTRRAALSHTDLD